MTRGTVKMLNEYLEQKDEIANITIDNKLRQIQSDQEPASIKKKEVKDYDPDNMKNIIVQMSHDDQLAQLILTRRPSEKGLVWLKYDDGYAAGYHSPLTVAILWLIPTYVGNTPGRYPLYGSYV